ncbi:hypothetical protein LCGC14_2095180 [marine sediment metagenome]|uniref:Uncharacterized protein n=1 Tax=marine sediment metagenome TaxID=412755 RepID=A0A0F9H8C3_9ZZZZ
MTDTKMDKTVSIDFTLQQFIGALMAALSEAGVISTSAVAGTVGVSGTAGAAGTFTTTKHAADTEVVEKYTQAGADWLSRDRAFFDRGHTNAMSHDEGLRNAALRSIDNAVAEQGLAVSQARLMTQFGFNKIWNINETDFIASQSLRDLNSGGVLTTATLAAMVKAFVREEMSGEK